MTEPLDPLQEVENNLERIYKNMEENYNKPEFKHWCDHYSLSQFAKITGFLEAVTRFGIIPIEEGERLRGIYANKFRAFKSAQAFKDAFPYDNTFSLRS